MFDFEFSFKLGKKCKCFSALFETQNFDYIPKFIDLSYKPILFNRIMDLQEKETGPCPFEDSIHVDGGEQMTIILKPPSEKKGETKEEWMCVNCSKTTSIRVLKIKGDPFMGLVGSTLGFFIGFAAVIALGGASEKLKEAFSDANISNSSFGVLAAIPNLSGSLLRIPFSVWADANGGRRPILVLLFLSLLGMLGLTIMGFESYPNMNESDFVGMCFLGLFAGCGIATFSPGIAQTSYWYPTSSQGWALGMYGGVGNLAPGIFSIIMAVLLGATDSDETLGPTYLTWFLLLLVGSCVYYFIGNTAWYFQLRETYEMEDDEAKELAQGLGQEKFPKGELIESFLHVVRLPKTWLLVGLYFTSFGGFIALAAWLPTYWGEFHQTGSTNGTIPLKSSLLLNSCFVIVGALTRTLSGSPSDKYGGIVVAWVGTGILAIGGIILTLTPSQLEDSGNLASGVAGILVITIGMGIMNAAVFKLVTKISPHHVGAVSGLVGGLGAFGGFVIPPILGGFVDGMGNEGYQLGFIVFIILPVLCAVFLLLFAHLMKKDDVEEAAALEQKDTEEASEIVSKDQEKVSTDIQLSEYQV